MYYEHIFSLIMINLPFPFLNQLIKLLIGQVLIPICSAMPDDDRVCS